MKNNIQALHIIFWIIAATHIAAIAFNIPVLQYASKPLLIPVLMILVALAAPASTGKRIILAALFFSWAGDVLLMFESMFIFGLVCFLTTHILYIVYFLRMRSENRSLLRKYPLLIILVLVYGVSLVWFLFPHLAGLKIPVMVYAAVICTMLLCSLNVFEKVKKPAGILFVAGAAFFVLSDSLLAVNKFYKPFAYAGVFIIFTYCLAQWLIVKGFTKQERQ